MNISIQDATQKNLSENLAKVFYAVAAIDRKITRMEIKKLQESLENSTIISQSIQLNTHTIFRNFEKLVSAQKDPTEVFKEFEIFRNRNKHLFEKNLNQQLISIAERIADSSAVKNKSELILLAKLKMLLKD